MTTMPLRRPAPILVMAIWLAAMPLAAHAAGSGFAPRGTPGGRVTARATVPPGTMPLTEAIRTAARRHAAGLSQAPAAPRRRSAAGCLGRIALFGAIGAGAGVAAAALLLASTGGSDDTSGILTRFGLLGAGGGAVAGAVVCAA